jgi:hypothetical protein
LIIVSAAGGVTTLEAFASARVPEGTPPLSVSILNVQLPTWVPFPAFNALLTSTAVTTREPES